MSVDEVNGNRNAIYQGLDPSLDYDSFDVDADVSTTFAMKDVLDRTPHKVQLEVRRHLARMSHPEHPLQPGSTMVIMPTGYGKSGIRDAHAIIQGGFAGTLVPLLSLGIDQSEKMIPFSKVSSGLINSIHLDDYKSNRSKARIANQLMKVPANTKQTFLLFFSPQSIVDCPEVQALFKHLVKTKLLRLLAIDEIHLFVQFGKSGFRKVFCELKATLFDEVRGNNYQTGGLAKQTTCPILWMTATCTKEEVDDLESMTGIAIKHNSHSIFWPSAKIMFNTTVTIDLRYTETPIMPFKKLVFPELRLNRTKKYLYFTNNKYTVKKDLANITMALDTEPLIKADVIPLTGDYIKEQKMWHLLLFAKDNASNVEQLNDDSIPAESRPFNPQLLFATADSMSAGHDNKHVVGAARAEFPPTCSNVIQEKGRPGRFVGASLLYCWYLLCISLESYCSIRRRYERSLSDGMPRTYYSRVLNYLADVAEILVIPQKCIHAAFAEYSANPYVVDPEPFLENCGDRCSFCCGKMPSIFLKVKRNGVVKVLMDVFLHKRDQNGDLVIEHSLIDAIRNYKDDDGIPSKKHILNSESRGIMRPIDVKRLVLQLIAAKIIGIKAKWITKEEGLKELELHATLLQNPTTLTLSVQDDSIWSKIPTK
jgi:hypothetical protein